MERAVCWIKVAVGAFVHGNGLLRGEVVGKMMFVHRKVLFHGYIRLSF